MENHADLDMSFGGHLDVQVGKTASSFYEEGRWHLRQGDPAMAVESFNAALELDGAEVSYHVGHVWASWSNGVVRSEACRRRLQSLLKRVDDAPLQAMIHGLLGRLEAAMNNAKAASEHYKAAKALDPEWEASIPEPAGSASEVLADEKPAQEKGGFFRNLISRLQL